jgi:hypothetical protein
MRSARVMPASLQGRLTRSVTLAVILAREAYRMANKAKHLDLIQGVIGRISGNPF